MFDKDITFHAESFEYTNNRATAETNALLAPGVSFQSYSFSQASKTTNTTTPDIGYWGIQLRKFRNSIFLFWFAGHGIKCYQCTATKSWDDCVPGKNTTCPPDSNTCAKLDIEVEEQGQAKKKFHKACFVKSKCNEADCKLLGLFGVKVTKCDVNCCHSDLCNWVKVPMASSFLFVACSLVVFFRWVFTVWSPEV